MIELTWWIPALPLAGFAVLALGGGRLSRKAITAVGVGSVGASFVVSVLVAGSFLALGPGERSFSQSLWTWMEVSGLRPDIGFHLDALSLTMTLVVTFVGFLIHVYSTEFMRDDEGYRRFFAYMNLFVASMLILLLADNLLFLYVGWEGVGLCSYLLIGFWYQDPANGRAAQKAFLVTRIGDTAMAIGFFLLFTRLGTLEISSLMERASAEWTVGSGVAVAAASLLLAGAIGKSAQIPLQTWLPDAMVGPTPVSALIHAATMVTAGVYLIARTHVLFSLAPVVQLVVALVGVTTLLVAAASALVQHDIKRILAYSTISQIGYMFLALGVGAWSAAIFHFLTHAFFKALLFLGAGAVILALHHEHDVYEMGGLRRKLPITFWTFLAGAAALAGFPLITSGFFSKDWILLAAWESGSYGPWLWLGGILGAFLTALYAFRLIFLVFFGEAKSEVGNPPGRAMTLPLIVLAVLSVGAGWIELPAILGHVTVFSDFAAETLPDQPLEAALATELLLMLVAAFASLGGIALAYALFLRRPESVRRLSRGAGAPLHRLFLSGFGFDWMYERVFVRPVVAVALLNRADVLDSLYRGIGKLTELLHEAFRRTQTGSLRWYAAVLVAGSLLLVGIVALG